MYAFLIFGYSSVQLYFASENARLPGSTLYWVVCLFSLNFFEKGP
jgi:hypothetical protein